MTQVPNMVTRMTKHAKVPYLTTDPVTHGCQKCKRSIAAGERHWFDPTTRNRFHQACQTQDHETNESAESRERKTPEQAAN